MFCQLCGQPVDCPTVHSVRIWILYLAMIPHLASMYSTVEMCSHPGGHIPGSPSQEPWRRWSRGSEMLRVLGVGVLSH